MIRSSAHRRIPRALIGAIAALGLTTLAACGSSSEAEPREVGELDSAYAAELDGLYEKAVDEGQTEVVLYGTVVQELAPVYEAFNARYPDIEIQPTRLVGAELSSKLEQERASGNLKADLLMGSGTQHVTRAEQGYYEAYAPPTIQGDLHPLGEREGDLYTAPAGTPFGIAYSTQAYDDSSVPAGWDALLDEDLVGKLVLPDPTQLNGVTVAMNYLREEGVIDTGWISELAAQDVQSVAGGPQMVQALGTGEAEVGFGVPLAFIKDAADKGAPVDMHFPTEGGSIVSQEFVALLDGAPHSDAAKLFYSWLFTPEAQDAFADLSMYGFMEGAPAPEGYPELGSINDLLELKDDAAHAAGIADIVSLTATEFR